MAYKRCLSVCLSIAMHMYWLTVKSQMFSTLHSPTQGIMHGLATVARNEKLPGLYRGIGPTLLAIAPFMAVQQANYDVLKHKAMSHNFSPSPLLFFVCGSIAGAAAQSVRFEFYL